MPIPGLFSVTVQAVAIVPAEWRRLWALALTWTQVDEKAGVIRLEPGTTKNRDGRTFLFAALAELAGILKRQKGPRAP